MIERGDPTGRRTFRMVCDGCQAVIESLRVDKFAGIIKLAKRLHWKIERMNEKERGHFCPNC